MTAEVVCWDEIFNRENVRRQTWEMMTLGYTQEQKEQTEKTCEKVLRSWEDIRDSNFQGNFKKEVKRRKGHQQ